MKLDNDIYTDILVFKYAYILKLVKHKDSNRVLHISYYFFSSLLFLIVS